MENTWLEVAIHHNLVIGQLGYYSEPSNQGARCNSEHDATTIMFYCLDGVIRVISSVGFLGNGSVQCRRFF